MARSRAHGREFVLVPRGLNCLLSALGSLEHWGRIRFMFQKENEREGAKSGARKTSYEVTWIHQGKCNLKQKEYSNTGDDREG